MSSSSPCAACKFLRRKCLPQCILAPHFPPDQPQKFANVHKAFGRSNVEKILKDIPLEGREEAVTSLAYEADALLRDPIRGCVGTIHALENNCKQMRALIDGLKQELATYTGGHLQYNNNTQFIAAQQQQQQFQQHMMMGTSSSLVTGGDSRTLQPQQEQMLRSYDLRQQQYPHQQQHLLQPQQQHYHHLQLETQHLEELQIQQPHHQTRQHHQGNGFQRNG